MQTYVFITWIVFCFICAYVSMKLAENRNRSKFLWFILNFFFTPLLVVPAIYLAPVKEKNGPDEVY